MQTHQPNSSKMEKLSRWSNKIFCVINAVTFVVMFPMLVMFALAHSQRIDCTYFITVPMILCAVALAMVSFIGYLASYYKADCLYRIYFFLLFLWLFSLISVASFLLVLREQSVGRPFVPGTKIQEFKLQDYTGWIRRNIIKDEEWYRVRDCLPRKGVCDSLMESTPPPTLLQFYQLDMDPVQSGCCRPPLRCGFKYVNVTFWEKKRTPEEEECKKWSNAREGLCYECDSCKAGVISGLTLAAKNHSMRRYFIEIVIGIVVGLLGWFPWTWNIRENRNQNQNQGRS